MRAEEGGGIEVGVALVAAQAVLVEKAVLRGNLFGLEHAAFAAETSLKGTILPMGQPRWPRWPPLCPLPNNYRVKTSSGFKIGCSEERNI